MIDPFYFTQRFFKYIGFGQVVHHGKSEAIFAHGAGPDRFFFQQAVYVAVCTLLLLFDFDDHQPVELNIVCLSQKPEVEINGYP